MSKVDLSSTSYGNPLTEVDNKFQPAPGVNQDSVYRCCCGDTVIETMYDYYRFEVNLPVEYRNPNGGVCPRCRTLVKLRSRDLLNNDEVEQIIAQPHSYFHKGGN